MLRSISYPLLSPQRIAASQEDEGTHMWHNDLAAHQHEVVDAHACPFPPRARLLPAGTAAGHTAFRTHFTAPVEEHPDVIAFLDLTYSAGNICAVVEHEWDQDLCRFDLLLQGEEFLAQLLARLCVSL